MKAPAPPGRVRDAAALLPLAGLVLLMPPLITLFAIEAEWLGVPAVVAIVFFVWLALIGCAALVARRLRPPR